MHSRQSIQSTDKIPDFLFDLFWSASTVGHSTGPALIDRAIHDIGEDYFGVGAAKTLRARAHEVVFGDLHLVGNELVLADVHLQPWRFLPWRRARLESFVGPDDWLQPMVEARLARAFEFRNGLMVAINEAILRARSARHGSTSRSGVMSLWSGQSLSVADGEEFGTSVIETLKSLADRQNLVYALYHLADAAPNLKRILEELHWSASVIKRGEKPTNDDDDDRGDPKDTGWIEIKVVDDDGIPYAGEQYELTLPDSTIITGTLPSDARIVKDGIPDGNCTISFPNLHTL